MPKYDVAAFGDYLADFTPMPDSPGGNPVFEVNTGGTTANMAAGCACLGLRTLSVGKVGDDLLGHFMISHLSRLGVDTSGLVIDKEGRATTSSFVYLDKGERSFSFFRKYNADIALSIDEINLKDLLDTKIIAFSGMSFHDQPIKSASIEILRLAENQGLLRVIDINYRNTLWDGEEIFRSTMLCIIPSFDVYKSSDEEVLLITGCETVSRAMDAISDMGPKLVIVSCGSGGAHFRFSGVKGHLTSYQVPVVDTTGAGDCFFAAVLFKLIERGGIDGLTKTELEDIIDFANAAGAVSVGRRGGAASMPSIKEVQECLLSSLKRTD